MELLKAALEQLFGKEQAGGTTMLVNIDVLKSLVSPRVAQMKQQSDFHLPCHWKKLFCTRENTAGKVLTFTEHDKTTIQRELPRSLGWFSF